MSKNKEEGSDKTESEKKHMVIVNEFGKSEEQLQKYVHDKKLLGLRSWKPTPDGPQTDTYGISFNALFRAAR